MNIVIMGAGEVGKGLARGLTVDGHNVCVVDINQALLDELQEHVDVQTILGNGASLAVLKEASIESADIFISVSASDEHNLLSCGIAKQCGVSTTIARVRGEDFIFPDRTQYQKALNIDFLINPDEVAAQELYDILVNPVALSVTDFAQGKLKLVGMRLKSTAPICNHMLKELPQLGNYSSVLISTVVRGDHVIIPNGETSLLPGDLVYVITDSNSLGIVNEMGGVKDRQLKRIVMVGASRVTYFLDEFLNDSGTRLTVIERDSDQCDLFSRELNNSIVLKGDGTDISILHQSGIEEADGFVASAQEDETNILVALLAKEQGAKRVIALLRKPQYIPLMHHIKPIDVAINPRIATIQSIMRYIRQGKVLSMAMIANDRAEALEVVVAEDSPLAGKKIKDINIPDQVLLGAIIRDGEVRIPSGDDTLETNDGVIVIGLKHTVDKLDQAITQSEEPTSLRQIFRSIAQSMPFINSNG